MSVTDAYASIKPYERQTVFELLENNVVANTPAPPLGKLHGVGGSENAVLRKPREVVGRE